MDQLELTKEQLVAELKGTLDTLGWKVVENELTAKMLQDHSALADLKRPEGLSPDIKWDDFLRGRIDMVKWVLREFRSYITRFEQSKLEAAKAVVGEPEAVGSPYVANAEDNPPKEV